MKNRQMLGFGLSLPSAHEGKRVADIPTLPELENPGRSHTGPGTCLGLIFLK